MEKWMPKALAPVLAAVLALILIAAPLLSGCRGSGSGNSRGNYTGNTGSGDNEAASSSSERPVYLMAGKITAEENVEISSRITARVKDVYVEPGAHIRQGDPLMVLESRDLDAQVEQARAGVEVAETSLVKIASGARPEQVEQARAACDAARSTFENARNTLERNRQLYAAGAISQAQLDNCQMQLDAAQAGYESSQAALEMVVQGESRETVAVAAAQVEQARTALEYALALQENAEILAPVSGTVSARYINSGETARAGESLLVIVNEETLAIDAYVPVSQADRISTGQRVRVRVPEMPDRTFNGVITVVGVAVDSGHDVIPVKIRLMNADAALKDGMFVEIGLEP